VFSLVYGLATATPDRQILTVTLWGSFYSLDFRVLVYFATLKKKKMSQREIIDFQFV
jgi:hypothetical protein